MTQVQLIARHTITPGHEAEVFALLAGFIDDARAEPGNLAFDSYRKPATTEATCCWNAKPTCAWHALTPPTTS